MHTVTNGPEPCNQRALDTAANVIPFPTKQRDPYSALTANLVLQRFRSGTLDEAVFLALMASAGLRP